MIKSNLFVCVVVVLILIPSGNLSQKSDHFGRFWGPCPAKPIEDTSSAFISDIMGKWYTHRVLGRYSPWKYFPCQLYDIFHHSDEKTVTVTDRFDVPIQHPTPVEWNGLVEEVDASIGKYNFNYTKNNSSLMQNAVFLQTYRNSAALLWTCFDWDIFHIESIAIMTQYQDPDDPRVDSSVFKTMDELLIKSGISPAWFVPITQNNCNFSIPDSSSLSENFRAILTAGRAITKQLNSH